ncbi:TonB-dependent receptor, partial [Escherichia coli]|nr:TonB-dependent receptor [Escherichia coli]
RYRIESLFGRINYDYQQKYLLSFTARYDGISKLKDNRWGFFPGVSAGWNVTQEEWWKNSKISNIITNIKPRISYGVNGNVNGIDDFAIYGV